MLAVRHFFNLCLIYVPKFHKQAQFWDWILISLMAHIYVSQQNYHSYKCYAQNVVTELEIGWVWNKLLVELGMGWIQDISTFKWGAPLKWEVSNTLHAAHKFHNLSEPYLKFSYIKQNELNFLHCLRPQGKDIFSWWFSYW